MSRIDESMLSHRRAWHLNFENLVKISKKGAIINFPNIIKTPSMFVDIVFMGNKQNQVSSSKSIQHHNHWK